MIFQWKPRTMLLVCRSQIRAMSVRSVQEKAAIVRQLQHAHEETVETCKEVSGSSCDLLEVCCGPSSNRTNVMNNNGGVAYRVGIQNKRWTGLRL